MADSLEATPPSSSKSKGCCAACSEEVVFKKGQNASNAAVPAGTNVALMFCARHSARRRAWHDQARTGDCWKHRAAGLAGIVKL